MVLGRTGKRSVKGTLDDARMTYLHSLSRPDERPVYSMSTIVHRAATNVPYGNSDNNKYTFHRRLLVTPIVSFLSPLLHGHRLGPCIAARR